MGFDYKYSVDKEGNVYSYFYGNKPKKMAQELSNAGYLRVGLIKNKKQIKYSVHRLILEAYQGKKEGFVCNHIDRNKRNNNISNLEWLTVRENYTHSMVKHGVYKNKNRFISIIQKNKKQYFLGSFLTKEEARKAYDLKFYELYC